MKIKFLLLILFFSMYLSAQDTLPSFKVTQVGNSRVIIEWINNYPVVNQINIQRSSDSINNFSTIVTVPDPSLTQNGITDPKAPNIPAYYRLFILFDNGKYLVTPSKRASSSTETTLAADYGINDTQNQRIQTEELSNAEKSQLSEKLQTADTRKDGNLFTVIKHNESFQVKDKDFKRFRDSILYKTKDTLDYISIDTIRIKPVATVPNFVRSKYVYTERSGNVILDLPMALQKDIKVRFLQDDRRHLFTIDQVTDTFLQIDKAIFLQAGWYRFEIYEGDKLIESNRIFIAKDF